MNPSLTLRHVAAAVLATSALPVVTKRASGLPSSQVTTAAGRVTRRDPAEDSIKLTRRDRRRQIRRVSNTWSDSAVLGSFPHQNFTDCDRGQRGRDGEGETQMDADWGGVEEGMGGGSGFRRFKEDFKGKMPLMLHEN